jgi:hypothetical protein
MRTWKASFQDWLFLREEVRWRLYSEEIYRLYGDVTLSKLPNLKRI